MLDINFLEIGERIKKQRMLLGYSREKLAEMADITPRFCYDLELGLKKMSLNTLCRLSDSLHISTDYILFGESENLEHSVPMISLIEKCPPDKTGHLEQIISHYIQAVRQDIDS